MDSDTNTNTKTYKNLLENNIFVFWTGNNEMSEIRMHCLENIKKQSCCNVILVTPDNLKDYILPEVPLHEAYEYLHLTHKADYLRTYFMNFHGGGYCDIKRVKGSWVPYFDQLLESDENIYICGYPEISGGVARNVPSSAYRELIGNGAYICKPMTPLTQEWYNDMITLLDTKLVTLRKYHTNLPSILTNVELAKGSKNYPIRWTQMLGEIFHKLCYNKYKDNLLRTLPRIHFSGYR
jgi:hypothetical protein